MPFIYRARVCVCECACTSNVIPCAKRFGHPLNGRPHARREILAGTDFALKIRIVVVIVAVGVHDRPDNAVQLQFRPWRGDAEHNQLDVGSAMQNACRSLVAMVPMTSSSFRVDRHFARERAARLLVATNDVRFAALAARERHVRAGCGTNLRIVYSYDCAC